MSERLILFTRHPEPGKATRLISVLGATAAVNSHRQIIEHTLAEVKRLQQRRSLTVES